MCILIRREREIQVQDPFHSYLKHRKMLITDEGRWVVLIRREIYCSYCNDSKMHIWFAHLNLPEISKCFVSNDVL